MISIYLKCNMNWESTNPVPLRGVTSLRGVLHPGGGIDSKKVLQHRCAAENKKTILLQKLLTIDMQQYTLQSLTLKKVTSKSLRIELFSGFRLSDLNNFKSQTVRIKLYLGLSLSEFDFFRFQAVRIEFLWNLRLSDLISYLSLQAMRNGIIFRSHTIRIKLDNTPSRLDYFKAPAY